MDPFTATYFNQKAKVISNLPYQLKNPMTGHLFTDHDFARLAGAPDGSTITVSLYGTNGILLEVDHPYLDACALVIHIDREDQRYYTEYIILRVRKFAAPRKSTPPKSGIGSRMFAIHARAAKQLLNAKKIILMAAGPPRFVGYKVWPKLGFDARLDSADIAKLPSNLSSCTSVLDLLAAPGGYHYWEANGTGRNMTFDLDDASRSWNVLNEYLRTKGIIL